MKHIKPTTKSMPVPAFTINPACVPCLTICQDLGKPSASIGPKCEAKAGEPCAS